MDKQTLLDLLEDHEATISIPYKETLDEHFTKVEIGSPTHWNGKYFVVGDPIDGGFVKCKSFDEAWELFSPHLMNVGLLQKRVAQDVADKFGIDRADLRLDNEEHRKVFIELINEEYFYECSINCSSMYYRHPSGMKVCTKDNKKCSIERCPLWKNRL